MIRDYVCVDIETTGCYVKTDKIIEIGAVKVRDGKVTDVFSHLINPGIDVPPYITKLTGITNDMVKDKEDIETVMKRFVEFAGDDILLGHNIMFDYSFLKQSAINHNIPFDKFALDTLKIARKALPELESRALDYLCKYYDIPDENHHRAFNDAEGTSKLYLILGEKYEEMYPEVFEPKELVYKAKKIQPATIKQIKYIKDLINYHNLDIEIDYDNLSRSEASRKIDKILSENGRIFDF